MKIQGFDALQLAHRGARVRVIPELGGKIASLELGGREWLWTSDVLPYRAPVDGTSYVETADSGGYDECFPAVGACTIPRGIPRWGGIALPDHGELWAQTPTFAQPSERAITMAWRGRRIPYRFERHLEIDEHGAVVVSY
jgi:hypothetical protein